MFVGDFRHLQGPASGSPWLDSRVIWPLAFDHAGIANAHLAYMSCVAVLATAVLRAPKGFGDAGSPQCAEDTNMNDRTIARITGAFGLACVVLTFGTEIHHVWPFCVQDSRR